ncbi:MAG: hypothetical protein B7733_24255 [Myxococcales bacterium FL481]|nr:MAG: hypothetical protein B7733_24255 [Myxococcales bacterium FL481]
MISAIEQIRNRARRLHRCAAAHEPRALKRLAELPEFRNRAEAEWLETLQRKHCFGVLARELGFRHWAHAKTVLSGELPPCGDFGTLLHVRGCSGFLNQWFADYPEAKRARAVHDGFLLAYRTQYLVVERDYIDTLGLESTDLGWRELGRDWLAPSGVAARSRLYATLVARVAEVES